MFYLFTYVKNIFYSILNYIYCNYTTNYSKVGCINYYNNKNKNDTEDIMMQIISDTLNDDNNSIDILTQLENFILQNGGEILYKKKKNISNIYILNNKLYKSMKLDTNRMTGYQDFLNRIYEIKNMGVLKPIELLIYPDNQIIEMYPYYPESDLFDIIYKKNIDFDDKINIITSIMKTLNSLHQNYFAHRDIKLENMLYLSDTNYVYLIDMVMSCKYDDTSPFYGGTPQYASPELLNQIPIVDWRHSDIWALGIVIYIIIYDIFPWVEADINCCPLFRKYKENPEAYWEKHPDMDPKIKKILSGCLVVDPNNRLNISQLIEYL